MGWNQRKPTLKWRSWTWHFSACTIRIFLMVFLGPFTRANIRIFANLPLVHMVSMVGCTHGTGVNKLIWRVVNWLCCCSYGVMVKMFYKIQKKAPLMDKFTAHCFISASIHAKVMDQWGKQYIFVLQTVTLVDISSSFIPNMPSLVI